MELELVGLNLEGLLSRAAQAGVRIRAARRVDARTMRVCIDAAQRGVKPGESSDCGPALRALLEEAAAVAVDVRVLCVSVAVAVQAMEAMAAMEAV